MMEIKAGYQIKIFLSSPGDVSNLRVITLDAIREMKDDPWLPDGVSITEIAWEKPNAGPMIASLPPQEAVNLHNPKPSECDIVVVIFHSRMGTPISTKEFTRPDGTKDRLIKSDNTSYVSGTEWECLDAIRRAEEEGIPRVVIYRWNGEPKIKPSEKEALAQWGRVQKFFSTLGNQVGVNWYIDANEFETRIEYDLKVLIKEILAEKSPMPLDSKLRKTPSWEGSPFPGLNAFTENQNEIFYGRSREINALVDKVMETRFVGIVGASGIGKSSLAKAGLIPRLKKNAVVNETTQSKEWSYISFTPGWDGDPFITLANSLNLPSLLQKSPAEISKQLTDSPDEILQILDAFFAAKQDRSEAFIFMDQFEEIFTIVEEDKAKSFVKMLSTASKNERVRLLITLRSDFYQNFIEIPEMAQLFEDGHFPLSPPTATALLAMITKPAEKAGLDWDQGLIDQILEDILSAPSALPLLAYCLRQLYEARENENQLTLQAYENLGRVRGVVGVKADQTYNALVQELLNNEHDEIEIPVELQNNIEKLKEYVNSALFEIFRDLVEVEESGTATRQRAFDSDDFNTGIKKIIVDKFVQARLLVRSSVIDNDGNVQSLIEVAHEALFEHWGLLVQWLNETRQDLILLRRMKNAAKVWNDHNRLVEYLWRGEAAQTLQEMLQKLEPPLLDYEIEFSRPEAYHLERELCGDYAPKGVSKVYPSHERREEIGKRLNDVGDTRFGVGKVGYIPHLFWCFVPAKTITINNYLYDVPEFYISKYPVTYGQYRLFLEQGDGFCNQEWWKDFTSPLNDPGRQTKKYDNYPANNVSWHDAVAFSLWADSKLHQNADIILGNIQVRPEWGVRLPTEWEWQSATQNAHQRYPWGDTWNEDYLNSRDHAPFNYDLTAVGLYPIGETKQGIADMAGNIQEWCLNTFAKSKEINFHGTSSRVIRSGSFYDLMYDQSTYNVDWDNPTARDERLGFRLVYAPKVSYGTRHDRNYDFAAPEMQFSVSNLKENQEIFDRDLPLTLIGKHNAHQPIRMWVILQFKKQLYIQQPPILFNDNGEWIADNVRPGRGIEKIHFVVASVQTHNHFRKILRRQDYGPQGKIPHDHKIVKTIRIKRQDK
jgi:hypothetical protein